ncbi:MAG: AbrB/MazE/SpoVT family DNA-binding domain-containing protein [Candidatus Aceula lacicola]|nr:AbrB/MazE/SpoVT family DNA-binding domain-containing protein [Candidatus Aceula lacicola]
MTETKKEKRKLIKTGTYTYMVTLPKEWVQKLGWRAKQMVELEQKGEEIVIRDWKNKQVSPLRTRACPRNCRN